MFDTNKAQLNGRFRKKCAIISKALSFQKYVGIFNRFFAIMQIFFIVCIETRDACLNNIDKEFSSIQLSLLSNTNTDQSILHFERQF